jgi:ribosomal protein S18 acetylase RimI-like enzyme
MTEVLVRPATPADVPAAVDVWLRSWRSAYRGLVPAPMLAALDPDETADRWRRTLADPNGRRTLVAVRGGTVLGTATFGPYRLEQRPGSPVDPAVGEVYAIYVDPAGWGGGTGRALLAAAVRELRADGPRPVRLWVAEANERARRFYTRFGFRPDGERAVYLLRQEEAEARIPELRYALDGPPDPTPRAGL